MFRKKYIYALCGVIVACGLAQADESSTGAAGANELRIPVGARSTALWGSNIGDVNGVEAMFWNPGGLANMSTSESSFGNYSYWADIEMYQIAFAHKFENFGSFGLSARLLNLGDLFVTTEAMPEGTGEIIQPKYSIVTASWARAMTDRVSLGANLNLLSEKVKDMSATGVALDFGVQVETPMEGLSFGVVLKNFGPEMKFDGYGGEERVHYDYDETGAASRVMEPQFAPFELPSSIQFGVSYDALEDPLNHLTFHAAFQGNHYSSNEYRFGAEYAYQNQFFARSGYVIDQDGSDEYLYSWAAGFGFRLDLGVNDLVIDWSYNPNEYFDASQWYTVRFEF